MSVHASSIVVVDDEPAIRSYVAGILRDAGHRCAEAADVDEAMACVESEHPELVVTDLVMPGGSGLSLLRMLREQHPDVASLVLTARDDRDAVGGALDGGAYGYVVKPFKAKELQIAVEGALAWRLSVLEGRVRRDQLEELVLRRTRELEESRAETVERLARAVDSRDAGTGEHIQRMSDLARQIALELGWTEHDADILRLASVLHDVGKIGIPDEILLKQGTLEPGERRVVESHAATGHAILAGARSELLRVADEVAWTHHERFDGSGYPRGLLGDQIPLSGRIAAVADVFDALTSDRPYRPALAEVDALNLMQADRGRAFDSDVLDGLVRLRKRRSTNGGRTALAVGRN